MKVTNELEREALQKWVHATTVLVGALTDYHIGVKFNNGERTIAAEFEIMRQEMNFARTVLLKMMEPSAGTSQSPPPPPNPKPSEPGVMGG